MKNKGFTLIELLAVLALMSLLGVLVTVNFTNSIKEANQAGCDEFVKRVEDGACTFAGISKNNAICSRSTGKCTLTLNQLVTEGYVKEEENTCTGEKIEDHFDDTVSVTWVNGEKKCTFNGEKNYENGHK